MPSLEMLSYAIYSLGGLLVILLFLFIRNEVRMKRLLRGKNAQSLEDTLKTLENNIETLNAFQKTAEKRLAQAEHELGQSIQHVGIVRFNPFKGTSGSNQSFATAFLDKKGNGVVVSSIYSREHVSVFAKPVENHGSSYDLSHEEKEAISRAQEEM